MDKWKLLTSDIVACERCPRLRHHCESIAHRKKPEFASDIYWGKPVPGFGDPKARAWILGLAPAAHGANRTGRMFTGDNSGLWLYRALFQTGFANREFSRSCDDDLKLTDIYISAAARCAPPENKPTPVEMRNCAEFLHREFQLLPTIELFIAAGQIAFKTTLALLASQGVAIPRPAPRFFHGALYELGRFRILASYHPSQQNTFTGKLTETMWRNIFLEANHLLNRPTPASEDTARTAHRSLGSRANADLTA